MIDTLWIFGKRHLRKHITRIVATTHPYLSGIVAFWLVLYSGLEIKPYALAGFFVPYDTVVFGFTATAIALAIAIPSTHFILFLSAKKENSTAFRDFLFVLIWNGLVHVFAFFLFVPFLFLERWVLTSSPEPTPSHVLIFCLMWLQLYACAQFLVTTITVFELADLYALHAARERENR